MVCPERSGSLYIQSSQRQRGQVYLGSPGLDATNARSEEEVYFIFTLYTSCQDDKRGSANLVFHLIPSSRNLEDRSYIAENAKLTEQWIIALRNATTLTEDDGGACDMSSLVEVDDTNRISFLKD